MQGDWIHNITKFLILPLYSWYLRKYIFLYIHKNINIKFWFDKSSWRNKVWCGLFWIKFCRNSVAQCQCQMPFKKYFPQLYKPHTVYFCLGHLLGVPVVPMASHEQIEHHEARINTINTKLTIRTKQIVDFIKFILSDAMWGRSLKLPHNSYGSFLTLF